MGDVGYSRSTALSFALISVGIFSSLAFGLGVDLSVANHLQYQIGDEVSPFISAAYPDNLAERRFFENLMYVDLYIGEVRIGFRYDHFEPSNVDQRLWALSRESSIDKRFIEWSHGGLDFRAGHFPAIFGRGLTLYLFEDRLLYHDTELDGVKLSFRQGPVRFTALKGDSREWGTVHAASVTGVNVEVSIENLLFGVNYVKMDSGGYPEADLPGVHVDFSVGPVSFYGEYAEKVIKITEGLFKGMLDLPGRNALYLSSSFAGSGFSVFADYKYYSYQGATPFQNPPIVQRELTMRLIQSREPHVVSFDDEVGFQIEGQITPVDWGTFTLNYTQSSAIVGRDIVPSNDQENRPFIEMLLEADLRPVDGHRVRLGLVHDEEARALYFEEKLGFYSEWESDIWDPYCTILLVEGLQVNDELRDRQFQDWLLEATVTHAPEISASVTYQLTTDEELEAREGDSWLSGEMSYSFGEGSHTLRVFYGQERGGLKCTGGVCRMVQAFQGLKISLDSSF